MLPENGTFKVKVKANQNKNEITGYDEERDIYLLNIKEKAENNKANIEIIKYMKRLLKKDVKIIKGITNKEKVIKIL